MDVIMYTPSRNNFSVMEFHNILANYELKEPQLHIYPENVSIYLFTEYTIL
jgi:hypothetical protein